MISSGSGGCLPRSNNPALPLDKLFDFLAKRVAVGAAQLVAHCTGTFGDGLPGLVTERVVTVQNIEACILRWVGQIRPFRWREPDIFTEIIMICQKLMQYVSCGPKKRSKNIWKSAWAIFSHLVVIEISYKIRTLVSTQLQKIAAGRSNRLFLGEGNWSGVLSTVPVYPKWNLRALKTSDNRYGKEYTEYNWKG